MQIAKSCYTVRLSRRHWVGSYQVNDKTVLVVEDDLTNRLLLTNYLARTGFKVLEAGDGAEALSLVEAYSPDLVLMDVRIPGGVNGVEVARIIRQDARFDGMPIIVLTASGFSGEREAALAAGCQAFMEKPLSISVLGEMIHNYLSS